MMNQAHIVYRLSLADYDLLRCASGDNVTIAEALMSMRTQRERGELDPWQLSTEERSRLHFWRYLLNNGRLER